MSRLADQKPVLIVAGLILAIVGAAFTIWRTQFAAPKFNLELHQTVARALAEETAKLINQSGKIVVITVDLASEPELKVQLDEFARAIKRHRKIEVAKTYKVETEDKPKYSFGSGLSARRFVRIVNKNLSLDVYKGEIHAR